MIWLVDVITSFYVIVPHCGHRLQFIVLFFSTPPPPQINVVTNRTRYTNRPYNSHPPTQLTPLSHSAGAITRHQRLSDYRKSQRSRRTADNLIEKWTRGAILETDGNKLGDYYLSGTKHGAALPTINTSGSRTLDDFKRRFMFIGCCRRRLLR